jgi:pyridoxine kinase
LIEFALGRVAPWLPFYSLDTVHWTGPGNHPRRTGREATAGELTDMLAVLLDPEANHGAAVGTVLAGYLRTPEQVAALAGALHRSPDVRLILDPVLGDDGRLYVPRETADAVAQLLATRAEYVLPNATELRFLAGNDPACGSELDLEELAVAYSRKIPGVVIAKSIPTASGLAVGVYRDGKGSLVASHAAAETALRGSGDLFSALFSAHLAANRSDETAASASALIAADLVLRGRPLRQATAGLQPIELARD